MTFKDEGYQVVRNVLSKELLLHLKTEFEILRDVVYFKNKVDINDKYHFGDGQSPNSFPIYSAIFFESLAINLNPLMNDIVGLNLFPTYTYARMYYKGSILKKHVDRPSCEYSTTICIDSTDLWDFYVLGRDGKEKVIQLNPGDMCVYSGCEIEHWRNPYMGERQIQCFLHYVNSEGPYASQKYDKRPMMGLESTKDNLYPKLNKLFKYN